MGRLLRYTAATFALGAAPIVYGTLIERNAFTLRRFQVPVLDPGSPPVRVLHISDLHITPNQKRKLAFVADLARLAPDLVINTGDTISHEHAIPAIMRALKPLSDFPAAFVPGNNDYFSPMPRNPLGYFKDVPKGPRGKPLPWSSLATAMTEPAGPTSPTTRPRSTWPTSRSRWPGPTTPILDGRATARSRGRPIPRRPCASA